MSNMGPFLVGLGCGGMIGIVTALSFVANTDDHLCYCADLVCHANGGRYLDGRCYQAETLREVRP